jgi:hypothetical protein
MGGRYACHQEGHRDELCPAKVLGNRPGCGHCCNVPQESPRGAERRRSWQASERRCARGATAPVRDSAAMGVRVAVEKKEQRA